MTSKLYIIGNGFDLHHELKTRYDDFAEFLKKRDNVLYDFLEWYIEPKNDDKLWSNFEENLANLNIGRILFDNSFLLPNYTKEELRPSDREAFPYAMEEYLEKTTGGLIESFGDFIRETVIPQKAYNLKLDIDQNAKFLTFNFTNTLETVYNIDKEKILFIHNSGHYDDNVIIGHGIDPENFEEELPDMPDDIDIEDNEAMEKWYPQNVYWEYSESTGKEMLMKYFERNYKPTRSIIEANHIFFADLKSVNEIYILGHSLSSVDLPYFEEIIKSVNPSAKWFVSYFDNSEIIKHSNSLTALGVDKSSISLFKLEDILQNNK